MNLFIYKLGSFKVFQHNKTLKDEFLHINMSLENLQHLYFCKQPL